MYVDLEIVYVQDRILIIKKFYETMKDIKMITSGG